MGEFSPRSVQASPAGELAWGSELLERSHHLAALDGLLSAVGAGLGGRLVLIAGEAGVGKTALVRRFCAAQQQSAGVLWGGCDALFTPRALGPFLTIADTTGGELGGLVAAGGRPHEVVAALIGELAGRKPTIVVVEDVHWADEATLDVLRLLGRRVGSARGLVLVTYRDDELGPADPLRLVLGELPTGESVDRLKLEPLSLSAVARLAGPSHVDVDELCRRTGGNPLFVTEVLAAGEGEAIPSTVRDAVLARAARLSKGARDVLGAVAVVPAQAELWLLEALAGVGVGRLDECVTAGMLVAVPGGVSFRHELARLAVEESLTPVRRLSLHRAALRALTRGSGGLDFARLAHHAEAAWDSEAVLRYAPAAAAHAASVGAHREAAAQYARALRFADGAATDVLVGLLEGRSQECYLTGQFEAAVDAEERALQLHRGLGDRRGEGDSLRRLSRLEFYAGRVDQAEEVGRQAVALLEQLPPGRDLAWAYSNLSMMHSGENPEAASVWGSQAVELAERLNELEILCHALSNIGLAEFLDGNPDGRAKLERSLDLALRAGFEEGAGRAFSLLAVAAIRSRLHDLAAGWVRRGIDYATERDLGNYRLFLLAQRARLELDRGRWSDAVASAELACQGGTPYRVFALVVLGLVRARRGDPGVWPVLDEALALAPASEVFRLAPVAAARAEAAWLEGRNEAVVEATQAASELAHERAEWAVGELACWRLRAGIRDTVPAGVAEPYAAQLAGDWARAAELWAQADCPYEAALAHADADTEESMRRALNVLQQLGARPAAEIVARRLRQHGASGLPRGPRSATRHNPANLTAREVEVLALVTRGLHNRDIAERLFVSTRTVDHHISAILRKLGVATRGEAAVEAIRLGIACQDR